MFASISGFSSAPSTGLFSQQPQQTAAPATGGLFGASTSSAFGQSKPTFGFGAQSTAPTLFGQPQPQQSQATSVFGATTPAAGSSIFATGLGILSYFVIGIICIALWFLVDLIVFHFLYFIRRI